jgi:prevent-host-death family protein
VTSAGAVRERARALDEPIPIAKEDKMAKIALARGRATLMKSMSAKEAKDSFGRLIDTARASPVVIEKHRRPVVVVLAVEEYDRLKAIEIERAAA